MLLLRRSHPFGVHSSGGALPCLRVEEQIEVKRGERPSPLAFTLPPPPLVFPFGGWCAMLDLLKFLIYKKYNSEVRVSQGFFRLSE